MDVLANGLLGESVDLVIGCFRVGLDLLALGILQIGPGKLHRLLILVKPIFGKETGVKHIYEIENNSPSAIH